jgi:hypothetical protein
MDQAMIFISGKGHEYVMVTRGVVIWCRICSFVRCLINLLMPTAASSLTDCAVKTKRFGTWQSLLGAQKWEWTIIQAMLSRIL